MPANSGCFDGSGVGDEPSNGLVINCLPDYKILDKTILFKEADLKAESQKKPRQSIQTKAYACLARRALFSKELFTKLKEKGYPEKEIAALVKQLTERGWLNDQDLAQRYVESQRRKGVGARLIALKLKDRAGEVACQIEDSEEELLVFVKKRYLKDLPEKKSKVIGALMRRGHSYDLIKKVLTNIDSTYEE